MIIAALEIENYKQYLGSHRIEFPEHGIVAVTGPNGAGKTTLFEAIEWCLYCPRSIPQASVPPHEGVGRTVVRVTLQDLEDGKRYCVQRELRSSGTQAEIYLEDELGQAIVQGTREVTRYVARHLIGLSHGAFVSTFFTRQKELQFFGDRSATERRTEVGRLLGLEAVREAQREIGEGRTTARSRADSLREEYERRLGDRDLEAEQRQAASAVSEAETREAEQEQRSLRLASEAETAQEEVERQRELQAQDAALGQALAEIAGAAATAGARRDSAISELARLEARSRERESLASIAGMLAKRAAEAERFEAERNRARQLQQWQSALRTAEDQTRSIAGRLQRLVTAHQDQAAGLVAWSWSNDDAIDPAGAAERLRAVAASLQPGERRSQVERLQGIARLALAIDETSGRLDRLLGHRARLEQERDAILAAGDPEARLQRASQATREALEDENKERLALAAASRQRKDEEELAARLREHQHDTACPTCSRPLGEKEAATLIARCEAIIERLHGEERDLAARAQAARERVVGLEQAEGEARSRLENVRGLQSRLADGQQMIDEAQEQREATAEQLRSALETCGLSAVPAHDEIAAAQHRAECEQAIAGQAGLLERLHDDAVAAREARQEAAQAIEGLGTVDYDEAAHRAAEAALQEARRAAAHLEQIDIELASRARYEEQQAGAERDLAQHGARREQVSRQRGELGFDPAQLKAAQESAVAAQLTASEAREAHLAARSAVREAQAALNQLESEHRYLKDLVEDADRQAREADDLTRMYEEFGEFDRYVARHVGPLLAETTERMLSQVTSGKYDQVRFDENYGIDVFDGDQPFPLAGFSGGERDVVALCARLALSEVVGSSALRPPRFLVLDEVFGSLDSERRAQLLETLGALAHAGHFRQMFIISHVDDVQQSPVMNEAWTIEEREGVSRVARSSDLLATLA